MRFGSLIIAGLAAVASAIPASDVKKNIDTITSLSMDLQTPAKGLSILDGPLLAAGQGNFPVSAPAVYFLLISTLLQRPCCWPFLSQPIIQGFQGIVQTGSNALDQMNPDKYSGADADMIFEAFRTVSIKISKTCVAYMVLTT